jgi:predicted protein tyrosine phosphatase
MGSVRVAPIMLAAQVAKEMHATHVISLVDLHTQVPCFEGAWHLIVRVDDDEDWSSYMAPNMIDVRKIFGFVPKDADVLVHCEGGISRSTAVGIGLWHGVQGLSVKDAFESVARDRPNLDPNTILVQLIDAHLGADGSFTKAVFDCMNTRPRELMLWCAECQVHFRDGDNCPGRHWR